MKLYLMCGREIIHNPILCEYMDNKIHHSGSCSIKKQQTIKSIVTILSMKGLRSLFYKKENNKIV